MFILRRITSEGLESNTALGDSYNFVDKEINPEHFREMAEHIQFDEKAYAFISCQEGGQILPLYVDQSNYIMTEGGKTFANVSQR